MGHRFRSNQRRASLAPSVVVAGSRQPALRFVLAGVIGGGLLAACAGASPATPSPTPGTQPVTFVYVIDGPDAGVAHTTHVEILDAANALVLDTTLQTAGTVDTGTIALKPGNYAAIAWDEQPASPNPVVSTKCGSPFTIDPGQALVVTITASPIGACLTDTTEPGAASSPSSSAPASSPFNPGPS
jgi:hypothetical protein